LLRLGKRGARQQRIVAVTVATAIGGEVFLLAKEASVGAAAVGAMQPIGMEMLFEPVGASSIGYCWRNPLALPHAARTGCG
jgi:hypothetical protein